MRRRKFFLTLAMLFIIQLSILPIEAQNSSFQLRNNDFEAPWVPAPSTPAMTSPYNRAQTGSGTEPPFWHSFGSCYATDILTGAARVTSQHSRSTDTWNGIGYSVRINARSVLGIIANGNITTGRVHAGSTSAANAANYNFTHPSMTDFNTPWTSYPDSIRFWAKYQPVSASQYARLSVYIHDSVIFSDPPASIANSANHIVGSAIYEWQRGDQGWHQHTVPFDYASYAHLGKSPKYIIITFTTNRTPGSGNENDALWIDDIEFVYSAWLTDLRINDTTIEDFEKGVLDYLGPALTGSPPYAFPYDEQDFSWTTEVNNIVGVVVTNVAGPNGDADKGYTSILVTAQDSVTTKEYRVYYYSNASSDNTIAALSYTLDSVNAIPVSGFISSTLNYYDTIADPEEVRIPKIRMEDIVLSDSTANVISLVQATSINPPSVASITVRSEDLTTKEYTVTFSKAISSESKLSMIRIGGVNILNFDPDTLVYTHNITACVTANGNIPTVTYDRASFWANVSYTPATYNTGSRTATATIKVTAEDGITQTVYTVVFNFINNDAVLSGYRVASTNRNSVFTSTNNYIDVYSASFSTNPALTLSTTSGQQGCAAQQVVFPPTQSVRFFPDTNYIYVTAQDGIAKQTYKSVIKNTNCQLIQTTGNNVGLKYRYNGVIYNITVPAPATNNNTVTVNVTIPVVGPNVPPVLIDAVPQAPVVDTIIYTQPTARAGNSGNVKIIANDGVANKTYIINFTATISNDATLKHITYDGTQFLGIAPVGTTNYTNVIVLPSTYSAVPTIVGIPNFQWLDPLRIVTTHQAVDFSDTTVIEVTAENGTAKNTYKFAFELVDPLDNAYLKSIKYDNTEILSVNPTTLTYNVPIPFTTTTPPVLSAVPMVANASVFYTQPTTQPYQGKILVVSQNMQVLKVYTVNLVPTRSTDATLADLKVNGVSLQDFNPQGTTYTYRFPYTEQNLPVVTATANCPFAAVTYTQVTQLNTTVTRATVRVTPESGSAVNYTIDFSRDASPVTTIDTIKYIRDNQTYSYKVKDDDTDITVLFPPETEGDPSNLSVVLSDNRASRVINSQPDATNNFTGTVTVTAEDGTQEIYEISFDNTPSSSTLLTDILYDTISIPNFHPDTMNYVVLLPYNTTQIPVVSVVLDWKGTDTIIIQPDVLFGTSQIFVTSEDGKNTKIYNIDFQRKGSPDLISLDYYLGNSIYQIPNFNASILEYYITLPIATTDIPVLEYVLLDNDPRTTVDTIQQTTPNGTSQLRITTWEGNTLTYTVNFTVALSSNPDLSGIFLDGLLIDGFDANNYYYTHQSDFGTIDVPIITATAVEPDARIEIQQPTQFNEIAYITCYAGDTSYFKQYRILLTLDSGNNAKLNMITLDGNNLYAFNPNRYEYEDVLPRNAASTPVVEAEAQDTRATVSIDQSSGIPSTAVITVTAYDGVTTETYYVHFKHEPNMNAWLASISIDNKPIADFVPEKMAYDVSLRQDYFGTPIISAVPQDANAAVAVEYFTQVHNEAVIRVTAENQLTIRTYRVAFYKNLSISEIIASEIKYYPNPVTDVLHIETASSEPFALKIVDNYGRTIIAASIAENTKLDVSHLAAGMYVITINNKPAGKFVKVP